MHVLILSALCSLPALFALSLPSALLLSCSLSPLLSALCSLALSPLSSPLYSMFSCSLLSLPSAVCSLSLSLCSSLLSLTLSVCVFAVLSLDECFCTLCRSSHTNWGGKQRQRRRYKMWSLKPSSKVSRLYTKASTSVCFSIKFFLVSVNAACFSLQD